MFHDFLVDLAVVLAVAATTVLIARKLKIPDILAYLMAGLIIGPDIPIPLFADRERIQAMSELGVIFVMFSIGLEFTFSKFIKVIPTAGITTLMQMSFLFASGYTVGSALGWQQLDCIFLGSAISISSTMITSKLLTQSNKFNSIKEYVFGILIVQDVGAILFITLLTAIAAGMALSVDDLVKTLSTLGGSLLVITLIGYFTVPKFIRAIEKQNVSESLTVAAVGLCFVFSVVASHFGYSVALGAFIAGVLIAESGHGHKVYDLILPLKNVFSAVFFVSIGMFVNPMTAAENIGTSLIITGIVILSQFIIILFGSVLTGRDFRSGAMSGIALGQIGEFAFIIAAIGVTANVLTQPITAILVTVAALTSFTTPVLLNRSESIISWVDRKLPHRIQFLITAYQNWLVGFRASMAESNDVRSTFIHINKVIFIDGIAMILIVAFTGVFHTPIKNWLFNKGVSPFFEPYIVLVATGTVCLPFALGATANFVKLANLITSALKVQKTEQDSVSKVLSKLFIFVAVGLISFPFFLVISSIIQSPVPFLIYFVCLGLVAIQLGTRSKELSDEIRSGSSKLVNRIAMLGAVSAPKQEDVPEDQTTFLLETFTISTTAAAVGKTLAEVNLRAATGASVVSIVRTQGDVILPTGKEVLANQDVLNLAGTRDALNKARILLAK